MYNSGMITEQRKQRFNNVIKNRLQDIIVLENIHDPHNALATIRNCDAFGIQTAHFIFETEKVFNPKALGKATSSSANKWVDIVCWKNSKDCFTHLKSQGYKLIATIIDPKAKRLHEADFSKQKTALIFGNEGFGISDTAKEMSDELVYISMNGFVDSINLSVSVGIMLHELSRQRIRSGELFLSKENQQAVLQKWTDLEIKKKMRL